MEKNIAEIFYYCVEVKAKVGHLIRKATYFEMLPTSIHNFKVTTECIADNIFPKFLNS